jgi:hypothetical protein
MLPLLAASFYLCSPSVQTDELQAWTDDVQHYIEELGRLHPDPFHALSAEELSAKVEAFLAAIGSDEERNVVEFMRLAASLARERDGHALVWSLDFDLLPLRPYRLEDGWFVVAAGEPHADLVGQRLLAIAGVPVEEAAERLAPLLSRDNDWNLRDKEAGALATATLLRGAGIQSGPPAR